MREIPQIVTAPRSLAVHYEAVEEIELRGFGDPSGKGVRVAKCAIVKQSSDVNIKLVTTLARLAK